MDEELHQELQKVILEVAYSAAEFVEDRTKQTAKELYKLIADDIEKRLLEHAKQGLPIRKGDDM